MTASANGANPTPGEVDREVRSVLLELLGRPNGSVSIREEVFGGRLLSLRQAEALKVGVGVVRVLPGTVVTPMARDHLRRARIELRVVSRGLEAAIRNPGAWGFAVESALAGGTVEALRRGWLGAEEWWYELGGSLEETARWVREGSGRGALVLTDEASLAVYRSCRELGVRAAAVAEVEAVTRARRAMGVNLLVVEPGGKPLGLIRQIAAAFRRGGAPIDPFCSGRRLP